MPAFNANASLSNIANVVVEPVNRRLETSLQESIIRPANTSNNFEDHRSDYISVTNHVVADSHELMLSRIQFTADLERKSREGQEHGRENAVYLKDDLAPKSV